MRIVIDIPKSIYEEVMSGDWNNFAPYGFCKAIANGIPHETVTDFADRCRECGKMRKGHWILQPSNKEQGERDFIWWKCSKCGQVIYSETEKDRREYHAFCSRCGAKMESEG